MDEQLYTLKEIAAYSHVTRQAVYIAIRNGKLNAVKRGKRYYVTRSNLDDYRSKKYNRDLRKMDGEYVFDVDKGHFSVLQASKIISVTLNRPCSMQRLYYLIRTGQLKAFKKGSAWIVGKEELIMLIDREQNQNKNQMTFA